MITKEDVKQMIERGAAEYEYVDHCIEDRVRLLVFACCGTHTYTGKWGSSKHEARKLWDDEFNRGTP